MTKQEIESLIDRLSPDDRESGTYCTRCDLEITVCGTCEFQLMAPVRIGDVLEKINANAYDLDRDIVDVTLKILSKWKPFGFTKSLQQIVDENGFFRPCRITHLDHSGGKCADCCEDEYLKSHEARAFFECLAELFPESK